MRDPALESASPTRPAGTPNGRTGRAVAPLLAVIAACLVLIVLNTVTLGVVPGTILYFLGAIPATPFLDSYSLELLSQISIWVGWVWPIGAIALVVLLHGLPAFRWSGRTIGACCLVLYLWDVAVSVYFHTSAAPTPVVDLPDAAWQGDLELVRELIAKGANVNDEKVRGSTGEATAYDGRPPLWAAASRGRAAIVEALIEAGASVEVSDPCAPSASGVLCAAAGSGRSKAVGAVLRGAALPYDDASVQRVILRCAAVRGRAQETSSNSGCVSPANVVHDESDRCSVSKDSVMDDAVRGGSADAANVGDGRRLLRAALKCDVSAVRKLLERGAPVDEKNSDGFTPLAYAVRGLAADSWIGAELGTKSSAPGTAPCVGEQLPIIRALLEHGADPNVIVGSPPGFSPLLITIECYGEAGYEALELLIEAGADLEFRGARGRTPLMAAALWHRLDEVERLLAAGADPLARDAQGKTAADLVREFHERTGRLNPETGPRVRTILDALAATAR